MININIPISRAKKIDSDEYVVGYYSPDKNYQEHIHTIFYFDIGDFNVDRKTITQIDPTTLAIQMGKRNLFMSIDVETGKGGDKISDNEVLVWNDEMMNCSILEIMDNGANEYEITLDNCDFDKMQVIGIQK